MRTREESVEHLREVLENNKHYLNPEHNRYDSTALVAIHVRDLFHLLQELDELDGSHDQFGGISTS